VNAVAQGRIPNLGEALMAGLALRQWPTAPWIWSCYRWMALQLSRKLACGDKKGGETRRFNSRHLDCWKLRHRRNLWQRREI